MVGFIVVWWVSSASPPSALSACVYFVDRDASHTLCHRGNFSQLSPLLGPGVLRIIVGPQFSNHWWDPVNRWDPPQHAPKSVSVGTSNLTWGLLVPSWFMLRILVYQGCGVKVAWNRVDSPVPPPVALKVEAARGYSGRQGRYSLHRIK